MLVFAWFCFLKPREKVVLYDISDAALDKAKVSIEKSVARVAKKKENGDQFMAETLRWLYISK